MRKYATAIFLITLVLAMNCETNKEGISFQAVAFLRIVHIAADPSIDVMDIYVNGEKYGLLDNLSFGSISGYLELPGGRPAEIILANKNSTSNADQVISRFNTAPLKKGSRYIAVITGVTNSSNFVNPDPANRDINLQLQLISNIRENSANPSLVDLIIFHGSTDAPKVDILADGSIPPLVNDLDFSEHTASYISVNPTIDRLDITPSNDNNTVIAWYDKVNFSAFTGKSILLFASGFLNTSQNQNGPSFRLLTSGISSAGGKMAEPKLDYSQIIDIVYSRHVQPIFQTYCVSCHSGTNANAGLRLDSWNNLIAGSNRSDHRGGEAIIPFDADNSLMIEMFTKLVNGPHPLEQGADTISSGAVEFLARWVNEGAKNDNGDIPYQHSVNRLYVCNQGAAMLSVIDTDAKVVIRNIRLTDLGYSATAKPHDAAVEPNGQYWYVSLIEDGKVVKFDKDFNRIGDADFDVAGLLAMHPTKDLLYVGHTLSVTDVPPNVGVITRSTMNLVTIPVLYERPHAFVADHSGRYVFSASLTKYSFGVIDTDVNPNELAAVIPFGSPRTLVQMNISPDDQEIYISSQLTHELLVLDSSTPTNLTLVDSINVGEQPWHPKFTPDGSRVYVGNLLSNTVSVVNTSARTVETTIGAGDGSDGLSEPHGLVISPYGQYVYVTNRNVYGGYSPRYNLGDNSNVGTVVMINTSTNTIEKVIELEEFPSGVALYEQ